MEEPAGGGDAEEVPLGQHPRGEAVRVALERDAELEPEPVDPGDHGGERLLRTSRRCAAQVPRITRVSSSRGAARPEAWAAGVDPNSRSVKLWRARGGASGPEITWTSRGVMGLP